MGPNPIWDYGFLIESNKDIAISSLAAYFLLLILSVLNAACKLLGTSWLSPPPPPNMNYTNKNSRILKSFNMKYYLHVLINNTSKMHISKVNNPDS